MNTEDYSSFENMFQRVSDKIENFCIELVYELSIISINLQVSSTGISVQPLSSSSNNDQDELIARKKLEQKRLFQQKQGRATTDVDSLMQSMFTDLKLKPKLTGPAVSGWFFRSNC